jgi:hypothetical protein
MSTAYSIMDTASSRQRDVVSTTTVPDGFH